jgi:hypothetical protein
MSDSFKKKTLPMVKPRLERKPTKVETTKKTKEANPRKFEKHKKKISACESKFEAYLEELAESKMSYKEWKAKCAAKAAEYDEKVEYEDNMADSDDSDEPNDIELAYFKKGTNADGQYIGIWNHTGNVGKVFKKPESGSYNESLNEEGKDIKTFTTEKAWDKALDKLNGSDDFEFSNKGKKIIAWRGKEKIGEWNGFDGWCLTESEGGSLFVVYASIKRDGRGNGSAIVMAKDKADARKIMKAADWLERATIDTVEPAEDALADGIIEDDEMESYKKLKLGQWKELEWGT